MQASGVYGFEIMKRIEFDKYRIEPVLTTPAIAKAAARNDSEYLLTGVLLSESLSAQEIYEVESSLTFIEQRRVLCTVPVSAPSCDWSKQFSSDIGIVEQRSGGGSVIGDDNLFPGSRERFLAHLFQHLSDKPLVEETGFDFMYYKCVESCRLRRDILDIIYFLLYSGLETYAKSITSMQDERDASTPIAKLLQDSGFDFKHTDLQRPQRSVSTYTHLRNALFHASSQEAKVNVNGQQVVYRLGEHIGTLTILLPLIIMKAINFDDGHINWKRIDNRMYFRMPASGAAGC